MAFASAILKTGMSFVITWCSGSSVPTTALAVRRGNCRSICAKVSRPSPRQSHSRPRHTIRPAVRRGKMIVIEAAQAPAPASALGKRDLNRFLASAQEALGLTGEFSVLLTGDERLRALNLQFRGKDKATDVLSFTALPEAASCGQGGDLAISLET